MPQLAQYREEGKGFGIWQVAFLDLKLYPKNKPLNCKTQSWLSFLH